MYDLTIKTLARFDAVWAEVERHDDNLIQSQSGFERLKRIKGVYG